MLWLYWPGKSPGLSRNGPLDRRQKEVIYISKRSDHDLGMCGSCSRISNRRNLPSAGCPKREQLRNWFRFHQILSLLQNTPGGATHNVSTAIDKKRKQGQQRNTNVNHQTTPNHQTANQVQLMFPVKENNRVQSFGQAALLN